MEMNFSQFLVWLTSGGSIVAVSWLLEKWAWFQGQIAETKRAIVFGSSAALSLGAYYFNAYASPELINSLTPIFAILATTFVSVFLGQMFHFVSKDR